MFVLSGKPLENARGLPFSLRKELLLKMHSCTPDPFIAGLLDGSIWSARLPLNSAERLACVSTDPLPKEAGLYRIHLESSAVVAYVGQTGDIRRRINELARGVSAQKMPFTDPHFAGPGLWAYARTPPYAPFTVSFALVPCSAFWRQGLEDLEIALQRQRSLHLPNHPSSSPLVQYHKMPLGWRSSSTRAKGVRGGKTSVLEPCHAPSIPPRSDLLAEQRDLLSLEWAGFLWSPWRKVGMLSTPLDQQGLYRLRQPDAPALWFLGRGNIARALQQAARQVPDALISTTVGDWTASQLRELQTDCLALALLQQNRPPEAQYGGETEEFLSEEEKERRESA